MFHDKEKQLQRLEEELLEEENQEYADAQAQQEWLYNDLEMYNNDQTEIDPEDLSDDLMEDLEEEPSIHGPLLTAMFLLLGIFLVVCWWILRMRGTL